MNDALDALPEAERPTSVRDLDLRGLAPPMPLVEILEALMMLRPETALRARTDRRPVYLFEQLEVRGYNGICRQLPDGSHVTLIRKR